MCCSFSFFMCRHFLSLSFSGYIQQYLLELQSISHYVTSDGCVFFFSSLNKLRIITLYVPCNRSNKWQSTNHQKTILDPYIDRRYSNSCKWTFLDHTSFHPDKRRIFDNRTRIWTLEKFYCRRGTTLKIIFFSFRNKEKQQRKKTLKKKTDSKAALTMWKI